MEFAEGNGGRIPKKYADRRIRLVVVEESSIDPGKWVRTIWLRMATVLIPIVKCTSSNKAEIMKDKTPSRLLPGSK